MMSQIGSQPQERSLALRDYLAVVKQRKWLVLIVTGVITAGMLFYSLRQTPIYQSEAKVVVKSPNSSASVYVPPPNLQTEKELADSAAVAVIAAKQLHTESSPGQLLSGLSVDAPLGTEILVYSYSDPSPSQAQRRAQAFAEGYLRYRRQQALDDLLTSSQAVEQRMGSLNKQLQKVEDKSATAQSPSQKATLQAQSTSLVSQIAILQQRLSDLSPPDQLRVGQVVQPAGLPTSPVSPDHLRNVVLGLFIGLLFGVGLAFLREHFDDRLRGRDDLTLRTGAPVLAVVPQVSGWRNRQQPRLVTVSAPTSAAAEAYRTLRTGVVFAASQQGFKTLVLASARAGEGKTVTVGNLGVSLAQAGKRTILVSGDLRRPRLHDFFGVTEEVGLTNLLAGEGSPWAALVRSDIDNLLLLPSGPIPANPTELLGSDAMGRLVRSLEDAADFVLIDSAPLLVVADTITMAPFAGTVLFLADAATTNRSAVEQARQQLDQVNARIVGAVLNNFESSKARGYGYYYGYGSAYGSNSDPSVRRPQEAASAKRHLG